MNLPVTVDSAVLKRMGKEGEPVVVLISKDSGASSSFEFAGSNVRKYIFTWDKLFVAHTLRVPLSVWMANTRDGIAEMPKDLQSQNSLYPIITQFYPDPEDIAARDPRGNRGWRDVELAREKATIPQELPEEKEEVVKEKPKAKKKRGRPIKVKNKASGEVE